VLCATVTACAHPVRPTITGAELYSQIHTLQSTGEVTVGAASVRKGQVLTTRSQAQTFLVDQVIDKCHGGDPTQDVDCTLALLLDQRFTVLDHLPDHKARKADPDDQSSSIVASVVVIGLGVGVIGGLIYGVATCEFEGCRAVFGVPLVLIGGGALFLLGSD
jgi:hypothetical protein